ncbi:MAG: RNA polymerase sigma factor [Rhodospirillales bacterium]
MASTVQLAPDWQFRAAPAARSHDTELVERALAGDQAAFHEIVECHQAKVRSFISRFLHSWDEAEDVAQEVFAKAFFSLHKFRLQGTLASWLYRIAVNQSIEHLRRRKSRPLVYESELNQEAARSVRNRSRAHEASPDAVLARRQALGRLLLGISASERRMLVMAQVHGYTMEEIAEKTGRSVSAVKVRLYRVRKKLVAAGRALPELP